MRVRASTKEMFSASATAAQQNSFLSPHVLPGIVNLQTAPQTTSCSMQPEHWPCSALEPAILGCSWSQSLVMLLSEPHWAPSCLCVPHGSRVLVGTHDLNQLQPDQYWATDKPHNNFLSSSVQSWAGVGQFLLVLVLNWLGR